MRILFVNHISNGPAFNSGIAAVSAFVKKHAPGTETFLANISDQKGTDDLAARIAEISPHIIGFSIHTPHWKRISEHISLIRDKGDFLILCGGFHPTLCPEEVISHPGVDLLCRGEGESPMRDLIQCLEKGKSFDQIPGLWVKKKTGEIIKNPLPAPEILDDLPYWDREIFIQSGILPHQFSLTYIAGFPLASGRGCPYKCHFCNNASILKLYEKQEGKKQHFVRKRSVDRVMAECRFLMETYGAKSFEFWDEMFVSDRQWIGEFCQRYTAEINLPFICALRVERADEQTLSLLHTAGCQCIFMGVEVGNEEYRKCMLNRNMSNAAIAQAYENAKKAGLESFAWVMFGLPEETPEMTEETMAFLMQIRPDIIGWSVFHALPGTFLYDYCREKGYLQTEEIFPYQGAPDYGVPALKQPSFSTAQIMDYCNRFREMEKFGFRVNK